MVFSHVIRGRPGGLFQFSVGVAVRIILASASSSMHADDADDKMILTAPPQRTGRDPISHG